MRRTTTILFLYGVRLQLCRLTCLSIVVGGICGARTAFPASTKPNVLIILTDDQGYGDLGCHGNDKIHTPAIDKLYAQSTRLTRFYSQPVCTPSRAALMTGRYAYRTRAFDTLDGRAMMDPDEVTIAETFAQAGYRTGIFGKWHLGDNYPTRAMDQGFAESLLIRGGGIAHYSDWPDNHYSNPTLQHNGKPRKYEGYCTDIFVDATIRFIEQSAEQPFLAYLATNVPHDPLEVPEKYSKPYEGMGLGKETPLVYGMMTNLDENLARLFKRLDELKLSENTIVLYMSDNGPAMQLSEHDLRYNANLHGEKKQTYEGGIRVPCFVRWPGKVPAGRDIDRIGSLIDILPTLSEACGVPLPAGVKIDGVSLWPLLAGMQLEWPDRTLHFQWHRGNAPEPYRNSASMTQQYKLVEGKELYDLIADPREQNDIAAQHPKIVSQLRREYDAWLADVSSTREFGPPLIQLGSEHENPVVLNPNDWRRDDPNSKLFLGYWNVLITRPGNYLFTVRLHDGHNPPATVHFRIAGTDRTLPLKPDQIKYAFETITLPQGPAKIEAWVEEDGKPAKGMRLVTVERLQMNAD